MKRKRKRPIKLSETDYANYIMALKDERPVKVIIPPEDK